MKGYKESKLSDGSLEDGKNKTYPERKDVDITDNEAIHYYLTTSNGVSFRNEDWASLTEKILSAIGNALFESDDLHAYETFLTAKSQNLNTTANYIIANTTADFNEVFVELTIERHYTNKEANERQKRNESTEPTLCSRSELLKEQLAVIVGGAGQGKTSIARKIFFELKDNLTKSRFNRDEYFPVYVECKNVAAALAGGEDIIKAVSDAAGMPIHLLNVLINKGKPYFIFNGLDEVSISASERLISSISEAQNLKNHKILLTSRPGERHLAGGNEIVLFGNAVRKFTIKNLNDEQFNEYIEKIGCFYKNVKNKDFSDAVIDKENSFGYYKALSRNPLILSMLFSYYADYTNLPETRIQVLDDIVERTICRDAEKDGFDDLSTFSDSIKLALGLIAKGYLSSMDSSQPFVFSMLNIKNVLKKSAAKGFDTERVLNYFEKHQLFNENGFYHSLFVSYYVAYAIYERLQNGNFGWFEQICDRKEDYWKEVIETLLCYIDVYDCDGFILETLLDKMQKFIFPDYDLLCKSLNQFTENKQRYIINLVKTMATRGAYGIQLAEFDSKGVYLYPQKLCGNPDNAVYPYNPYEELFYYVAVNDYTDVLPLVDVGCDEVSDIKAYLLKELLFVLNKISVRPVYPDEVIAEKLLKSASFRRVPRLSWCGDLKDKKYYQELELYGMHVLKESNSESNFLVLERYGRGHITLTENDIIYGFYPAKISTITILGTKDSSEINALDKSLHNLRKILMRNLTDLQCFTTDDKTVLYKVIDGNLYSKDETTLIKYATGKNNKKFTIPNSVISIYNYVFIGCKSLTSITIPDSVTYSWGTY